LDYPGHVEAQDKESMTRKKNNEGDPSDEPKKPKKSDKSDKSDRLIPKHGGYEQLRSYQCARLIYPQCRGTRPVE
jgi:hypothetical protein